MSNWTPEAVAEAYRRAGQAPPADLGEIKPVSKYHSRRKEIDGIVFDSCAEARAYQDLKLQQDMGLIGDLLLQPRFVLQMAFRDTDGKRHRRIEYRADFQFRRDGQIVVVDVKGVRTPVFRIKEKMFREKFPSLTLEIWDTRKKRAEGEQTAKCAKRPDAPPDKKYPCTECGSDAFIGYSAGRSKEAWGGLVKRGERICTRCFRQRGGPRIL